MQDVRSEQRLQCFRLKYAADNTLGQGIHPVSAEVQRIAEKIEPEPSAHQVRGGVSPRIDQAHAHGEHERMSYAEIIPQDHISKEEKELLFVSGMMDPQPDHGVAENHGDDGQGLQQFKILLSCALYFRSHHVVFSAAALPPA